MIFLLLLTLHFSISKQEIGPWLREFRAENAVDFSRLTFDPGQKELVVGTRNYLFRLQLEDLSLIQLALTELAMLECSVLLLLSAVVNRNRIFITSVIS
ncbi:hypothetical protein STEG23_024487, partial [Scotinomys teguina]